MAAFAAGESPVRKDCHWPKLNAWHAVRAPNVGYCLGDIHCATPVLR